MHFSTPLVLFAAIVAGAFEIATVSAIPYRRYSPDSGLLSPVSRALASEGADIADLFSGLHVKENEIPEIRVIAPESEPPGEQAHSGEQAGAGTLGEPQAHEPPSYYARYPGHPSG
ncbi:hypothetical protein BC835DRAFT_1056980 [Cytidiella melzeri]|nr:hypothetical protein BC835DRAFT_1056980 [Cytidiella melzeri]